MSAEPSDAELIRLYCQERDEAAFRRLVNRYRGNIRRIVYTVLRGPEEDLEDVEQEILLSLSGALFRFSRQSDFSTFLYRLCRNKSIDFIRKRIRTRTADQRAVQEAFPAVSESAEDLYLREYRRGEILHVFFRLDEQDRSLIHLKDREGLSLKEIGKILRLPQGTVKSRLHRARSRAAAMMLEEGVE